MAKNENQSKRMISPFQKAAVSKHEISKTEELSYDDIKGNLRFDKQKLTEVDKKSQAKINDRKEFEKGLRRDTSNEVLNQNFEYNVFAKKLQKLEPEKGTSNEILEQMSSKKLPIKLNQKFTKEKSISSDTIDNIYNTFENKIPYEKVFKIKIEGKIYRYDDNKYYRHYVEEMKKQLRLIKNQILPDGKIQNTYDNDMIETILPNGANRKTFKNGYSIVNFGNNDIKQTLPDGNLIYFHREHEITHISLANNSTEVSLLDL